ncbi:MAG: HDIG domain-containing protein [Lentimicrobiaceae bacterium]|nr:HDIG domain-containing protein [Lentimicrobiaceae bacterium]
MSNNNNSSIKDFFLKLVHSYQTISKIFIFLCAVILVVWQMPRTVKFKYEYQKMKPWQYESLYAPFNFPIYKTAEEIKLEEDDYLKDSYPIFTYDNVITKQNREKMIADFDTKWTGNQVDKLKNKQLLERLYDTIENQGIIANISSLENMKPESMIDVVRDRVVKTRQVRDFYTMKTATDFISDHLLNADEGIDKAMINRLLLAHIHQNIIYSEDLTEQAREQAKSSISLTFGMVQKDELIINEGEIVTEERYNILNSLKTEYASIDSGSFFNRNLNLYGQILLVFVIFSSLFIGLRLLYSDIFKESKSINLIIIVMLMMIIPSFIIIRLYPDMIYVMPLTILAMLMVTFFNIRVAIYVQTITLIIISLAVPNPFQFFIIQYFVSLVSIFVLGKNTSRSRYFVTYASIFISYIVLKVSVSLTLDGGLDNFTWNDVGTFAMNTLFAMLTLPLSYLMEKIFGFVTDMTLLELSNTNSPLLRKLSSEAPGTFQHVMQVADLCEEALFAIGGNMLLARTGAMYHDVGKLKNPLFFTENQHGKYNMHNEMSYYESSQIIINHVLDGIEICRKYHVPEQIIDFARTHHGTRRTEYFYQMELKENPDIEVNEADFRYHGPIPFSKETAVLMMADSVEAASRSLNEKTEESISKLVDGIIDAQVNDNQFINTDLTFRDITTIKKVFKKKLMNIYHVRIAYPV